MKNIGCKGIGLLLLLSGISVPASADESSSKAAAGDAALAKKIQKKLEKDPDLKNNDVEVTIERGVATLKGVVDTRGERAKAESLAKVDGVARVDDQIEVGDGGSKAGTIDAAIESKVKARLLMDEKLRDANITVSTNDGVIVLSGSVPSKAARERAIRLARQQPGVTRVEDRLTIFDPTSSPSPILVPIP